MTGRQISVLIVDDESHVRQEMASFPWEEYGARLAGEASNGRDALRLFWELEPELLITDIEMPVMDGIELARAVREEKPHAQIVFLTCHDQFSYAQEGIELGITGYLLKIFLDQDKLGQLIDKARRNTEWLSSAKYREIEMERESLERALQHALGYKGMPDLSFLVRYMQFPVSVFALFHRQSMSPPGVKQLVDLIVREKFGHQACQHTANGFIVHLPGDVSPSGYEGKQWELLALLNSSGDRKEPFFLSGVLTTSSPEAYFRFARNSGNIPHVHFYTGSPVIKAEDLCSFTAVSPAVPPEIRDFLFSLQDAESPNLLEEMKRLCVRIGLHPKTLKITAIEWIHAQFQDGDNAPFIDGILSAGTLDEIVSFYRDCGAAYYSRISKRFEVVQTLYYIRQHYTEPLKLSDAAEHLHISANHLGKIFKKDVGKSFNEVLNETRIQAAIELLKTTNMKVYEVADAVGISSYRYFWNLFREIAGRHPSEYRSHSREGDVDV